MPPPLPGVVVCISTSDLGKVGLAAGLGHGAHAQDVVRALHSGKRTARVKDVEGVAALHNAVVRRQRQLGIQAGMALALVVVELLAHHGTSATSKLYALNSRSFSRKTSP